MYESFYGFRTKPFSLLPDPDVLYLSKKHRLALAMLEFGLLNQAGFTLITGEIGSGKTTLIRHVLKRIDHDATVGMVSNTHRSFSELLQWVLLAFHLEYRGKDKVDLYQRLTEFLLQEYSKHRRTILIIDEAQNMGVQALEEFRMLSNINTGKDQLLQLILVGQPRLRDILRSPEMEQLAQRVAVDYHLGALDTEETKEYICHRLSAAGGDPRIFQDAASQLVFEYSQGIPRLINTLCDMALVCGFAVQKKQVDAELVEEIAQDRSKGGILPVHKRGTGARAEQREKADSSSLALQASKEVLPWDEDTDTVADLRSVFGNRHKQEN
jgi:Type II secretory pathway, component ExeA (predicted ATPase)